RMAFQAGERTHECGNALRLSVSSCDGVGRGGGGRMSEESEVELVAELVGQLHRAAWQGSWPGVLEELARALQVDEVQIVVHRGRRWEVLMSSTAPRNPGPLASSWAGREVRLVTQPDPSPREGMRRALERLVPQVLDLAR